MLNYEVLTEEEAMAERFQLLKNGEYDAIISTSEDKVSSSGNPMMAMVLTVFDEDGKTYDIRDFLVFTKSMMWKVVHCTQSGGCYNGYQDGKFCSEMAIGKRVKVKVSVEEGKEIAIDKLNGKPIGSKYPDKNKIDDYLKRDNSSASANVVPIPKFKEDVLDDDVPF